MNAGEPIPAAVPAGGWSKRFPVRVSVWAGRTFESLVDRDLRILCLGTFINFLAVAMSATVHGVVAFQLTGSSAR